MNKKFTILSILITVIILSFSFKPYETPTAYTSLYGRSIHEFADAQTKLMVVVKQANLQEERDVDTVLAHIARARLQMKRADFWLRYLEPLAYKRINSPLPVEWETEVFEKFELPYRRDGAGLTLAALYLEEEAPDNDSLLGLLQTSETATRIFLDDSITTELNTYHHFYLCNRVFILNLAAIYTTGFECPDAALIIPELRTMMAAVADIYQAFNSSFPQQALSAEYLTLYDAALAFVNAAPDDYSRFNHFTFIRDYANPLFLLNQQLINKHKVVSRSLFDYSLNKNEVTIFSKTLYEGQNPKGIFTRVKDQKDLEEIDRLGKLLFYDPILSDNNLRSCASCHKPTQFFTDTTVATAFQFNHHDLLPRNTPTLVNAGFNHLLMADGKHYTMQHQAKDVICNPLEMASDEKEVVEKVLSCKEYKKGFSRLLKYTPQEPELSIEHIVSAITFYYSKFSNYEAPFDAAMNEHLPLEPAVVNGFNIFMSKGQCATCHFVPQFNGVKPPYIGSEFEILGVPADSGYIALSNDKGRFGVFAAAETAAAFRTGTVRNAAQTKPYMHNGVFETLEQVIDFYDAGGGAGHGLLLPNQTLPADSLGLTATEKWNLIAFIKSLNEEVLFEAPPAKLPKSTIRSLNSREPGGAY